MFVAFFVSKLCRLRKGIKWQHGGLEDPGAWRSGVRHSSALQLTFLTFSSHAPALYVKKMKEGHRGHCSQLTRTELEHLLSAKGQVAPMEKTGLEGRISRSPGAPAGPGRPRGVLHGGRAVEAEAMAA